MSLSVYTLQGREVARLVDRMTDAGFHTLQWNGTGRSGQTVAPGQYVLRMVAGENLAQQKFILTR